MPRMNSFIWFIVPTKEVTKCEYEHYLKKSQYFKIKTLVKNQKLIPSKSYVLTHLVLLYRSCKKTSSSHNVMYRGSSHSTDIRSRFSL